MGKVASSTEVMPDGTGIAWSVVGTRMTHHNASLQVVAEDGRTRGIWIADLLPHDMAPSIAGMIEQGLAVMKRTLEASADFR